MLDSRTLPLSLPAEPRFVGLARGVALAAAPELEVDRALDLALVVDEAVATVINNSGGDSLRLKVTNHPTVVGVEVTGSQPRAGRQADTLSARILGRLCSSVHTRADGDRLVMELAFPVRR